jgi:hypothetical protein
MSNIGDRIRVYEILFFLLALSLNVVLIVHASDSPQRYIKDGVFISTADPEFRIRVDERFSYIGNTELVLKKIAHCDRHYWVDTTTDKTIRAMVVLQFEGFLDGVNEKYQFSVPEEDAAGSNYRFSPKLVRIGNSDYVHNTWAFSHAADAKQNSGAESERTIEFLSGRGYKLDNELIMSRFVRAVGDESRKEFIVFYMEPLRTHGHSLADFPDGGPASQVYDRLSALITERSISAITFLSDKK